MSASDVAAFDSHQTDPAKLAKEIRRDMGAYQTPHPGDIRLIYDGNVGKPVPMKIRSVQDGLVIAHNGHDVVTAEWQDGRWVRTDVSR